MLFDRKSYRSVDAKPHSIDQSLYNPVSGSPQTEIVVIYIHLLHSQQKIRLQDDGLPSVIHLMALEMLFTEKNH